MSWRVSVDPGEPVGTEVQGRRRTLEAREGRYPPRRHEGRLVHGAMVLVQVVLAVGVDDRRVDLGDHPLDRTDRRVRLRDPGVRHVLQEELST